MAADAPKVTYAKQCKSLTAAKKVLTHIADVHSQVLQQVLQQLEKAFISMWEQDHGFPRFKKPGRMRSFLFPQFKECPVDGTYINLPKLGRGFGAFFTDRYLMASLSSKCGWCERLLAGM